jgi:hypothetical protein
MGTLALYFSLLSLLAPLMVVMGVGTVWGRYGREFPTPFIAVLCTTVTTPALVFNTLVRTTVSNDIMANVAVATALAILLCLVLAAIALKLCRVPVREMMQTVAFPNAGNLGLPITHLAFGDTGLSTSIAFFAVCSFMQHTLGVRTLPNAQGMPAPWKSPVLIASLAAVACRLTDYVPPQWIMDSAAMLGSLTVPLLLLSLGHALALIPRAGLQMGSVVGGLRLVLGLATGYAAGRLVGLPPEMVSNMTLQMGMPCAAVSYLYARRYTDKGDIAAGAVLMSTVVFLVFAPALLWVLGSPVAR